MFGPIKKAFRYLRREYPDTSTAMTIGLVIGAGVGTAVTFGAGAPLFVIPLAAGGVSGLANIFSLGEWDRVSENSYEVNGARLVGEKRDINTIIMTQKLIDKKTAKLKHLPELPEKTRKYLLAHITDAQAALSRLRVYQGYGSSSQSSQFSFHRHYYNNRGYEEKQTIATLKFEPAADQKAGKTEIIDTRPAPKKPAVVETPAVSPEFGKLAKKVEEVAKRVDELENPAPVVIDKKKLQPKA